MLKITTTTLRKRAYFAQRGLCIYCELPIWEPECRKRFAQAYGLPEALLDVLRSTAEHLVERQRGGLDHPANIAACCHWCNWKRHAHRHFCAPDPVRYQSEVRRAMAARLWHPAARSIERNRQLLSSADLRNNDCGRLFQTCLAYPPTLPAVGPAGLVWSFSSYRKLPVNPPVQAISFGR